MQKVIAKIYLHHIRQNAEKFRALTNKRLYAVVKANAYGHGAEETVNALEGVVDGFAVALVEEALAIRTAACGKEILVLTPPCREEETLALAENGFSACVPDLWTAKLLVSVCEKYHLTAHAHLKVNTGMNRYGMERAEFQETCAFLCRSAYVHVVGVFSHLYCTDEHNAYLQRARFLEMQALGKRYFPDATFHLSATFGALLGKEFLFDGVRIGIGLYGYLPDGISETLRLRGEGLKLQKAMTVYAMTMESKRVYYGGVGYGKPCSEKEFASLNPVYVCRYGYADGFLRAKENGVDGWENHANNLCMDACIRTGRAVRGESIAIMTDAERTAKQTGTIAYEVLCSATRRAEFIYE